jgi:hypothetical protein
MNEFSIYFLASFYRTFSFTIDFFLVSQFLNGGGKEPLLKNHLKTMIHRDTKYSCTEMENELHERLSFESEENIVIRKVG